MVSDSLLDSLRAAVAAAPDDIALRMHLAQLLAEAGRTDEAVFQAAHVLRRDPRHSDAMRLVGRISAAVDVEPDFATADDPEGALAWLDGQLAEISSPTRPSADDDSIFAVENVTERLSDVAGMVEVKRQIETTILTPLRHPDLGERYGRSGRGGLMLYGPPGCGKTFLARALAGEIGARLLAVGLSDILDMFVGQSEHNLAKLFRVARESAPCVVFFDEVDAIGQRRGQLNHSGRRGVVNQLLSELDGVRANNAGVFVLAATNHPWDVDVALRRPGRFDRMLFVGPPDEAARTAVLARNLERLPTTQLDLVRMAQTCNDYSGADIAYACGLAAESAMVESARSGLDRPITDADLLTAIRDVRPSMGAWFDTARNVVEFANGDGAYDDLAAYMRGRRML